MLLKAGIMEDGKYLDSECETPRTLSVVLCVTDNTREVKNYLAGRNGCCINDLIEEVRREVILGNVSMMDY